MNLTRTFTEAEKGTAPEGRHEKAIEQDVSDATGTANELNTIHSQPSAMLPVSMASAAGNSPRPAAPDASPIIRVENLSLFYGHSKALKNISIAMGEKLVTAFIGPSGCGKSTLLRCLNR